LIDPSNFRREFKKLTRAAGLGDWTPYEMRHSAASLLVATGVPIEEVADLFGHKDATTLMSVHRHDIAAAVDAGSTKSHLPYSTRPRNHTAKRERKPASVPGISKV